MKYALIMNYEIKVRCFLYHHHCPHQSSFQSPVAYIQYLTHIRDLKNILKTIIFNIFKINILIADRFDPADQPLM